LSLGRFLAINTELQCPAIYYQKLGGEEIVNFQISRTSAKSTPKKTIFGAPITNPFTYPLVPPPKLHYGKMGWLKPALQKNWHSVRSAICKNSQRLKVLKVLFPFSETTNDADSDYQIIEAIEATC